MILTDEEINALSQSSEDTLTVIRATERAVIAKLAAGVSVDCLYYMTTSNDGSIESHPYYTPKQFDTAIAAARVQAIRDCEDAIETANARRVLYVPDCIVAIRALIGKDST